MKTQASCRFRGKVTNLVGLFCLQILLCLPCSFVQAAADKLPPEETKLKDTVDHWGLGFFDQQQALTERFREYATLSGVQNPDYLLGVETPLRKTFRNKYWFKGKTATEAVLSAGRNESEAFQLAIIPKTGFKLEDVKLSVSALRHKDGKAEIGPEAVKVWQVGFVKTAQPQYPTRHVGYWPDRLDPVKPLTVDGVDLGLLWVEIKVPKTAAPGDYVGVITLTPANSKPAKLRIKLHVWDFQLPDRVNMPMMVWTKGKMGSQEYLDLFGLFLEHHVDPISAGQTMDLKTLDKNLEYCFSKGLLRYQTPTIGNPDAFRAYYEHIKKKGWLNNALTYAARDEPTLKEFHELVVPKTQAIRNTFPGLKIFLATNYYEGMTKGLDVWLADLSTNFPGWLRAGRPGDHELWWYFCGIPIRTVMERPIVDAPRMLIDRDAVEHRLVYWLAWGYDVKGMFVWAGNRVTPGKDTVSARMRYPYAGIMNGDGFLVYPGKKPSIRLKTIRDGAEDYWYLQQVTRLAQKPQYAKQAKALLDGIKPAIYVDPHYWNKDPDAILQYRIKLAELIEQAQDE